MSADIYCPREVDCEWNGSRRVDVTAELDICQGAFAVASRRYFESNRHSHQVYKASHMVGFDLPHVAHDMILRFIGVDFSVINSHKTSTGAIPSRVGDDVKPIDGVANPGSSGTGGDSTSGGGNAPPKGTTPAGDPAIWQGMLVYKYFTHHTLSIYCFSIL